jgi:ribosomal protein S18 acetylase RimI-like enzyme
MTDHILTKPLNPIVSVERVDELSSSDLDDLCDATDAAIQSGGGFGWVDLPAREVLERYWYGVVTMPARILFVARLDGIICGTCQLVKPPANNQAQGMTATLTTHFVTPWARGHGLARQLLNKVEVEALSEGFSVINLDVRETMTEAIRLYESSGFTRIGTHPYYAKVQDKVLKGHYYYKVIDQKAFTQEP